jgi:hypothetical protein
MRSNMRCLSRGCVFSFFQTDVTIEGKYLERILIEQKNGKNGKEFDSSVGLKIEVNVHELASKNVYAASHRKWPVFQE